ncbi:Peptidase U49, Lit peptidase [Arcobacter nitrofigilis DSM 7299]|uniref:Peptidase U49, Lit peptidase n=1 Tax=Arcobacter nitrofigilis (strain ATCC 33309 / DSM 7299 / CCUG 15893 / LMG 7604 / NCTC 12251 / CI) TaxID=572480 RepID=D5V094_ARCNC|nr:phage exclusion protein Lit family protein [Arcobacter nitrofigilis]ADG93706.1 Peptidase U49, Lit peptidase [Arcobacter nitrofigilis DSM 7299]
MKKKLIQVLHNNIINFFENTTEHSSEIHKKHVENGQVSQNILFDNSDQAIKFPFVNLDTKEITIQETHLSHLWSFTYAVFVIYEEGIQKKLLDNTFDGSIDLSPPLLNRANQLLSWSISLKDNYSDWNRNLPNPDIDYSIKNDETFYIEKINNLFQSSVAFLLYHEIAHLVNNHSSYYFGFNNENYEEIQELEKEADEYAFSMLIQDNEKNKIEKGLSIIIIFCSALMLSNKSNLKQKKHPDIDQRLLTILNKLNFDEIENEFYVYYLGSYILQMYFQKENIAFKQETCDTHKELFFKYLAQVDEIKQGI